MDGLKFLEIAKTGNIKNVNLFYGEEQYLILKTIKYLKNILLSPETSEVNTTTFDGKTVTSADIIYACESFPMFGANRLVIVKDLPDTTSHLDNIPDYLKHIPAYTYIIITTQNPDKRRKLYKSIKTIGEIVEFKPLSNIHLANQAKIFLKKQNKEIEPTALNMLIQAIKGDLCLLENETEKLINYIGARPTVTRTDVTEICSFIPMEKIFDLLNMLGNRDAEKAFKVLGTMINHGEQPISILVLIGRQLKIMLQVKLLSEAGLSLSELNDRLKAHPYVIKKSLAQSNNFSIKELEDALNKCCELDIAIKTGACEPKLALELLISRFNTTQKG